MKTNQSPISPQKALALAQALDNAGVATLRGEYADEPLIHDVLRPVIREVLGGNVGQNADWINVAFNLGGGMANRTANQSYLLEAEEEESPNGEGGYYLIATHVEGDDDLVISPDVVTLHASKLPAWLRAQATTRRNPRSEFDETGGPIVPKHHRFACPSCGGKGPSAKEAVHKPSCVFLKPLAKAGKRKNPSGAVEAFRKFTDALLAKSEHTTPSKADYEKAQALALEAFAETGNHHYERQAARWAARAAARKNPSTRRSVRRR